MILIKILIDDDNFRFIFWLYFVCSMLKFLKFFEDDFIIYCN